RVEDLEDRARLTLRLEDRGLRLALGPQDRRLLLTLGGEDLRLLDTLGREDRRTAVPLGAHLLLHRALHARGRVDRLELDTVDADAPAPGRLVEDAAQLAVDLVAAGQRLLQVHRPDDVTERGDRLLLTTGE